MRAGRQFATFWPLGLVLFAIAVLLSMPLTIPAVPDGILDHQSAGTAEVVNRIQNAWAEAGVLEMAEMAMIADLVFIGIYAYGSWQGGRAIRQRAGGAVRGIGTLVCAAAVVFLITDYGETIAQLIQLLNRQGSDGLAGFAALLQPIKVAAWITTFIGILAGMLLTRFTRRRA